MVLCVTVLKNQPRYPMIDISRLPDFVKLEITKTDLEAFARLLLEQSKQFTAPTSPAKEILTVEEAAEFTGLARQTLYGFTSRRAIPHFKRGKNLLFKRSELEAWMLSNKRKTIAELAHDLIKPKKR